MGSKGVASKDGTSVPLEHAETHLSDVTGSRYLKSSIFR